MNMNVSKTNGVKLLAVVAVLAMVVCAFAAVMPAEETDAAANDTQYYGGILDDYQPFTSGTNVIIDKDLTIKSTTTTVPAEGDGQATTTTTYGLLFINGSTVTINSGVTITVEKDGYLYFGPGSTVINNGTINVKSGGYFYNAAADDAETKDKIEGVTNNGTITIQRGGTVEGMTNTTKEVPNTAPTFTTVSAGSILVSADGSINSLGTKTTPSYFNNQKISMAVGATVELNSLINGVTVDANVGTGVYTYGSVGFVMTAQTSDETPKTVSQKPTDDQVGQGLTNVSFSVTSEKIADAYYGADAENAEKYTRANANILDVSGSLGAYTDATIKATGVVDTKATAQKLYTKAYGEDAASGFEIKGTVAITDSFKVNANTELTVEQYAIVNISGSVDVAGTASGENAGKATLTLMGILNVSGQVTIDSVADNTDGTVTLTPGDVSGNTNIRLAYLNIIGEGEIAIEDYSYGSSYENAPKGVNGVTYVDKDDVFHITNLDKAIAGAVAANNDDMISIWGYSTERGGAQYTNPYVISASISIPEGLTVNIDGYVVIAEGATVTVPEAASLDTTIATGASFQGYLVVEGELMDYTMAADDSGFTLTADVRTIDADETYYLYTSLKAALANANEGDTVEIYGNSTETQATVDIEGNVTIKSGVTVDAAGNEILVKNNATLTIDGVLDLTETGSTMEIIEKVGNDSAGAVVLNNMILVTDISNTGITGSVPGFYVTGTVGDYDAATQYIMAPAVAAANSATLDSVDVKGDVSYSGDLTFTAGEDNEGTTIEIPATNKVSISKIIIDGYIVNIPVDAVFTGTVEATTTAGASSVTFSKAGNYNVSVYLDESEETPVTSLQLGKATTKTPVTGSVTISTGSVELTDAFGYGADRNSVLTVASGATLVVSGTNVGLTVNASNEATFDYSAIVIDGTLAMDDARSFVAQDASGTPVYKPITVNGTMTVVGTLNIPADVTVVINGTLAVSEVEDEEGLLTVDGNLVIGTASETLGAGATVTGPINIGQNNYITVYAGSSVETAKLNVNATSGESDAVATEFFINGTLYMTAYAFGDELISNVLSKVDAEIIGYNTDGITSITKWYTDADFKNAIKEGATPDVGDEGYEVIYFNAPARNADIQYSVGSGISLFVDGVRITSGETVSLTVGTHTVTATVNPGYTGDVTITFNGQAVTGTFEVTPEMADKTASNPDYSVVLSATGNIAVDTSATGGDGSMGLTEILLIILVILIVVMAIMVALRLMRS